MSSGGFRLEQNRPTEIMMANRKGFDLTLGGKARPLSDRVGEHLSEWDEFAISNGLVADPRAALKEIEAAEAEEEEEAVSAASISTSSPWA